MMENIKADLNSMKAEKEQLSKRIDKIERKLHGIENIERLLKLAEKCRMENERLEKIGHLRLEQKNLVNEVIDNLFINNFLIDKVIIN